MKSRLAAAILLVAMTIGVSTGCAPEPEVSEPTPLFTSEADAFAAAEETYRAYVDALNQVDLSDPATFEDVFAWTTGDLNGRDRQTFSSWSADELSIAGSASVDHVSGVTAEFEGATTIRMEVCYNVGDVEVLDRNGESLVDPSRPDVQSLEITFVRGQGTSTGLLISAIDPSESSNTC